MPESLGRYILERRLAHGGMGEVWLSRQTGPDGFDRQCVVKTMHDDLALDEEYVAMFLQEAQLTARLNHPHVAQVYDFGKEQGTYFLAMEHVEGPSVQQALRVYSRSGQPMPLDIACRLVSQAAQALDFVHQLKAPGGESVGLVHRDVSPANILISSTGLVKLIDFGIAKSRFSARQTQSGMVKGKIPYMSPEQVRGEKLDGRSDLYSLGIVLFELLSLRRAILTGNELEMMNAVLSFVPSNIQPDCPAPLEEVVRHALAKNREDRFATAGAFSDALEGVLAEARWMVSQSKIATFAAGVMTAVREGSHVNAQAQALASPATPSKSSEAPVLAPPAAGPPEYVPSASGITTVPGEFRTNERRPFVSAALVVAGVLTLALGLLTGWWLRPKPAMPAAPPPVVAAEVAAEPEPEPGPAQPEPAPEPVAEAEPAAEPASSAPRPRATGTITVTTTPKMEVSLDGKPAKSSPCTLTTSEGTHRVKLRHQSGASREVTVKVRRDADARVEWAPVKGTLEIRAVPPDVEFQVSIDGSRVGNTPLEPLTVWEGSHVITAVSANGHRVEKRVDVPPSGTVRVKMTDGGGVAVTVKP